MSEEGKRITFKTLFYTRSTCMVCQGTGAVECCNADGQECMPIPCDRCDGKGYVEEMNAGNIVASVIIAALVIVAIISCI